MSDNVRTPVTPSSSGTDTNPTSLDDQPGAGARRAMITLIFSRYAVLFTLLVLCAIFTVTNNATFPTTLNFQNVLGDNSILLIITLGGLLPLIVGEFDLSIGFLVGLSAVTFAVLTGEHQVPWALAMGLTALLGAVVGAVNGVFVAYAGINSFIVTLAIGTLISGISLLLSNGQVLYNNLPAQLSQFAQGFYGAIPALSVLAAFVSIGVWFVVSRTVLGRRLYASGLGREPARLAGIKTQRLILSSFVWSGLVAGVAGVLVVGRVGAAHPEIGPDFLLPSLAAAFLGATVHSPGRFNVIGSIVAILFVGIGLNGLQLNGAPFWVQPVFQGGVLVLAVGMSRFALTHAKSK